ncbi:MAG: GntR family transcriptional regulator [Clostridium sp.]|nr:GntR family transcriptional regulator [Clostridium sp.]
MNNQEMRYDEILRMSVVEQASRRILSRITSGEYQPGDKLPSQKELREMLQVSLPTLREALSRLSAAGYITGAQGKGYFVNHRRLEVNIRYPLAEADLGTHDIRNVLETRIVLEAMLAKMASVFASDEECEALLELAEHLAGQGNPKEFYLKMAAVAHNEMLADMDRAILEVIYSGAYEVFRIFHDEDFRASHEEMSQREIAQAIRDRNPELAYQRTFLHLKAYADAISIKVRYSPLIEPFWK